MNPKILTLILLVILFNLTENTKNTHHTTLNQQIHETSSQGHEHSHKNHKKARIAQKQKFQIKDFITSLKQFSGTIFDFFGGMFDYFILKKQKKLEKQSVVYRQNFASQNGGAQILMVSSSKIKSPKAILKSDPDAYLFTADVLPITIVIGLKEQILIDSFVIQSGEVYSCIVQDFMIEGAFSLEKQEWILLGNFTAQNSFQAQEFAVEQRIIRYLRLTVLSSYGKWKYFTLTQIEVYGEGLFSHAMESLLQADHNMEKNRTVQQNVQENVTKTKLHSDKFSNKQIHTKQILVEAFTEVAGEQKVKKAAQMHKQQQLIITPHSEEVKSNDSQLSQKVSPKEKKSISNLKKKINYLEKRNYELHQELKELKKVTTQKLTQLQTKHHQKETHKHHHHSKWYQFLFNSHSIIYLSTLINIACLILVGLLFKNKIFSKERRLSVSLKKDQQKEKKNQHPQKLKSN